MTCKQLGGACDKVFQAETFEELAQLSQHHGREMLEIKDNAHLEAMGRMQDLMQNSDAMSQWMEEKRKEFDILPEVE